MNLDGVLLYGRTIRFGHQIIWLANGVAGKIWEGCFHYRSLLIATRGPQHESPGHDVLRSDSGCNTTSSVVNSLVTLKLASPNLKFSTGGAYVNEGMPQVPAKLVAKIRRWEYVEIGGSPAQILDRAPGR